MPVWFLKRDRKGVDLVEKGSGEELGEVQGGETLIITYQILKIYFQFFLKKKNCFILLKK